MIPFIRRRRFAYSIHTHIPDTVSWGLTILCSYWSTTASFLNPRFYFFPIGNNTHYDGSGIHHHHHHTSTKIQHKKKTKLHHFSTRDFRLAYFLIFFSLFLLDGWSSQTLSIPILKDGRSFYYTTLQSSSENNKNRRADTQTTHRPKIGAIRQQKPQTKILVPEGREWERPKGGFRGLRRGKTKDTICGGDFSFFFALLSFLLFF